MKYIVDDDIIKIKPYLFNYKTFSKGRWINKKIIDVMANEFKAFPREYYLNAINNGYILINGKEIEPNYIIKSNEQIIHYCIRNELPILNSEFKIIFENDILLIVNKPPSVPVHPCGSYFYNSMTLILKYINNKGILYRNLISYS